MSHISEVSSLARVCEPNQISKTYFEDEIHFELIDKVEEPPTQTVASESQKLGHFPFDLQAIKAHCYNELQQNLVRNRSLYQKQLARDAKNIYTKLS